MLSATLRGILRCEGMTMSGSRMLLPPVVRYPSGLSEDKVTSGNCGYGRNLSTSNVVCLPYSHKPGPVRWPQFNRIVHPPQSLEEERRPAYVCHMMNNIKYSPWKMWYLCVLIRGMTVDEALRQLDYVPKKGAHFVKQTLLEARELAVRDHNVEFRSNLWVAESFCSKGVVIKGIRRHARKRVGLVEYFHCHYFVRLEEGAPPKHYMPPPPDGPTLLQRWINDRRSERVFSSM